MNPNPNPYPNPSPSPNPNPNPNPKPGQVKLEAKKAAMALRRAPAEQAARESKALTLTSNLMPSPTL